jgi:enoyl-CoA hydratase/carnithine racemase
VSGEVLVTHRDDLVATVTINRPEQRNALNLATRNGIRSAIEELAASASARVVVLRGAGRRAFASGGDLRELSTMGFDGAKEHFDEFTETLAAIEEAPIPVIAMIDGFALGGGLELATACDLRISSDAARFGIPIGRIGHTLDKKNLRRVLRLVSPADLKAMLLTDMLIPADEARRIGLLNWVVPQAQLESFTYDVAARVAASAPLGVQTAKRLINEVCDEGALPSSEDADDASRLFDTEDFAEGVAAFFERRVPDFRGK